MDLVNFASIIFYKN